MSSTALIAEDDPLWGFDRAMYYFRSTDMRFGYVAGIAIEGISWR
jgi:hypothetical protein